MEKVAFRIGVDTHVEVIRDGMVHMKLDDIACIRKELILSPGDMRELISGWLLFITEMVHLPDRNGE